MSVDNPEITDDRRLKVERISGTTEWAVTEFNRGSPVMLIANTGGTQFHAHFTREQWAEFQTLIAGAER